MTGAPEQGAHELDPLSTRYGATEPLVLVSPSSSPVAWSAPPSVVTPAPVADATPESAAAERPSCLERLGQKCPAPEAAPGPAPGGPLETAAKARAWLDALDAAWAPRACRRAGELLRSGLAASAVAPAAPLPERELGRRPTFRPDTGEVVTSWEALPPARPGAVMTVRRERPGARPELVAAPGQETPPTPGAWHVRRSQALARPLRERVESCGQGAPLVIECRCGRTKVATSCGMHWLCPSCRPKRYRRLRARLAKSVRARAEANARAWHLRGRPKGQRREPYMVTLTVRHTGDLLADRRTIQRGWECLRKWFHKRIGAFDYALTWEVTPGEDGLGHVHAHAVALLPFFPYKKATAEWLRATGSPGANFAAPKTKDGKRLTGSRAAARAAEYIAKYASKGVAIDGDGFTPELAANVLDSAWGRRLCSTSHGFWLPKPPCECRVCKERWLVVEKPPKGERSRAVWAPELRILLVHEDGTREERWYLPFPHPGGPILR